jgi:hypothetical protein
VDFLSMATSCGASCMSRSAGKCANNRGRYRERVRGSTPTLMRTARIRAQESQARR